MTNLSRTLALVAAAATTLSLAACSGAGSATSNGSFGEGEPGFRAATKAIANAVGASDAEGLCSFLTADDQGFLVWNSQTPDCQTAVGAMMGRMPEDVRASWASVKLSDVTPEERDPGELCWPRGTVHGYDEGAWADAPTDSGVMPCLLYTDGRWMVDDDSFRDHFYSAGW